MKVHIEDSRGAFIEVALPDVSEPLTQAQKDRYLEQTGDILLDWVDGARITIGHNDPDQSAVIRITDTIEPGVSGTTRARHYRICPGDPPLTLRFDANERSWVPDRS